MWCPCSSLLKDPSGHFSRQTALLFSSERSRECKRTSETGAGCFEGHLGREQRPSTWIRECVNECGPTSAAVPKGRGSNPVAVIADTIPFPFESKACGIASQESKRSRTSASKSLSRWKNPEGSNSTPPCLFLQGISTRVRIGKSVPRTRPRSAGIDHPGRRALHSRRRTKCLVRHPTLAEIESCEQD